MQIDLAKYLARRNEQSKSLEEWFKAPGKEDISFKYVVALNSASNKLLSSFDATKNLESAVDQVASYIFGSISTGGKIKICEDIQQPEFICIKKENSTSSLTNTRYIFNNDKIISKLFSLALNNNKSPEWLISALTAKSKSGTSLVLRFDIGQSTLISESYGKIDKDSSASSLLLIADNIEGKNGVFARFRKPDGQWTYDRVVKFENFNSGKLHFSYDENLIDQMERREIATRDDY